MPTNTIVNGQTVVHKESDGVLTTSPDLEKRQGQVHGCTSQDLNRRRVQPLVRSVRARIQTGEIGIPR